MFEPYLLTRDPYASVASASRRFSELDNEALRQRLGNLMMSLDMWRLYGDRRAQVPVLNYDIVTRAPSA